MKASLCAIGSVAAFDMRKATNASGKSGAVLIVRSFIRLVLRSLIVAGLLISARAVAQTPQTTLAAIIQGLQNGTVNMQQFGFQLQQLISAQTGGTRIYPQLVQAGPIVNIVLTGQAPLPNGVGYYLQSIHQNGTFNWALGVSTQ